MEGLKSKEKALLRAVRKTAVNVRNGCICYRLPLEVEQRQIPL